ncbi:hypothetical protein APS_2214 [Acetobacter pasteurianus subsp. pasteurianus LMG 1262 = NBRC 106471]|nr:hypothetical protein APS_2214 [Acetobacter pasteurianus subsp. pasteurianus LMG 1262 = NBRC 106471]
MMGRLSVEPVAQFVKAAQDWAKSDTEGESSKGKDAVNHHHVNREIIHDRFSPRLEDMGYRPE